MANQRAANEQQTVKKLQHRVIDLEAKLGSLRSECQQLVSDLDGFQKKAERERESVARDAELNRYHALKAERVKWEALEPSLHHQTCCPRSIPTTAES